MILLENHGKWHTPPAVVSKLGPPPAFLRLVPVERPHLRLSHDAGKKQTAEAVSPASIRFALRSVQARPEIDATHSD